MARRAGLTREALHSKALVTGNTLLAEHGLAQFSMRKVAKQLGYTVGTLYNLFESQDDFLLQVNACGLEQLQNFIEARLDENLEGIAIVHNIANSYFTFAKENYDLWNSLFNYNLTMEQTLPTWYLEKIESLIKVAERALSALPLSTEQIRCSSRTLWASVHGICVLSLSGKLALTKSNSPNELIKELINKYFIGLTNKI